MLNCVVLSFEPGHRFKKYSSIHTVHVAYD